MKHEHARLALIGLSEAASKEDRAAAIDAVVEARDERLRLTIPIADGRVVEVDLPQPMTQTEFAQFRKTLEIMRPGIVVPAGRPPERVHEEPS